MSAGTSADFSAGPGYERRWETRGARRRGRAALTSAAGDADGTGTHSGGRTVAAEARDSYYGVPPIHKPHWGWLIVTYFFLGGVAGATYALAAIAEALGRRSDARIVRAGRYLSLAALLPCPVLLILDLGRPERFHHMLRVFKLKSPMSVGTWALTVFGAACGLSAAIQAARDGLLGRGAPARVLRALPSTLIGLIGAGPALFVGGYTGVLLAATAVPLWTRNFPLMGPLFVTSAASNAAAAIALTLALARGTRRRTLERLERLETLFLLAELSLLVASWLRVGRRVARPLTTGHLGLLNGAVVLGIGITVPLVIHGRELLSGSVSPLPAVAAAALTLIGGYTFRYVMVMAGRASADDPHATFDSASRPGGRVSAGGRPSLPF